MSETEDIFAPISDDPCPCGLQAEIERLREAYNTLQGVHKTLQKLNRHWIDEIERLRTQYAELEAEHVRLKTDVARELDNMADQIMKLRDLLSDVFNSGVSFDDPRVRYLEVQIDRPTWNEIRKVIEGDD